MPRIRRMQAQQVENHLQVTMAAQIILGLTWVMIRTPAVLPHWDRFLLLLNIMAIYPEWYGKAPMIYACVNTIIPMMPLTALLLPALTNIPAAVLTPQLM